KKTMDIAAHQDTIRNLMRSSLSERSNVRSVKRRKSTLSGNGTSPPIIVCNENSECTLSKSWTHQDRLSVPRLQLSQADGMAVPASASWTASHKRRPSSSEVE